MVGARVAVGVTEIAVSELVAAGIELVAGQLGVAGLEPVSRTAGQLLFESGVVGSVDQGVVLFHERVAKGRPHLGRILRLADRKAGRIPRVRLNARSILVKAGLARRSKGKLAAMSNKQVLEALRSPLLSKRSKDIVRKSVVERRKRR